MLKYKVVEGPKNIIVEKNNSLSAFSTFENIINREAAQGWMFHSMQDITVTEKLGCLESLVFRTPTRSTIWYMLIFCKDE